MNKSKFHLHAIDATPLICAQVGGSRSTAGWVVGITALGTGCMQPFLGYPLKHYRLKTLMLMLCGFNFVGWILYALGDLSGSLATILVARVITGLAGGPTWLSTYVARSTSTDLRSHYMQYVSLSVGFGYGIGPFIGGALYAICSSLDLDGKVFNKYTSPGWLWAGFALVVAALLQTFTAVWKSVAGTTSRRWRGLKI